MNSRSDIAATPSSLIRWHTIWRSGWSGPKVSSPRFQFFYSVFGPKRLKAFSATQGTAGWWEEKLAQLWETWSSQTSASKHTALGQRSSAAASTNSSLRSSWCRRRAIREVPLEEEETDPWRQVAQSSQRNLGRARFAFATRPFATLQLHRNHPNIHWQRHFC